MEPVRLRLEHVLYGGDYNPEQWSEEVRDEDARLMRLAHWNVATLPVFGWVHLNPAEAVFNFDWLDRIVDRLSRAGVDLCLATATASTPAWMDQQYPDVLTVDDQGRKRPHGNRHAHCPNSPSYRRLAGALVREIAKRYGSHPRLLLWHVNNEYGGHWPSYCYCERCVLGFRAYLEKRYGTLDALNAAWSTAFWGHTFTSFSHIDPPLAHGEESIQALKLDWRRFSSSSYFACYEYEASILREATPKIPVTTNFMGPFQPINYHEWGKALDVVAWDSYPRTDTTVGEVAFRHALMRGVRDGQPYLLMEQSPSHQNWATYCRLKPPGQVRLFSYQAIAHGAESVMYFQWRKSRGGIEKFHGAVLEHHGQAESRVFREIATIGAELEGLGTKTLEGRIEARVAVVFDWESWWALGVSSGPSRDLDYQREVVRAYSALHAAAIPADVVPPDADLARYDVIVLACAYMVRAEQAHRIAERTRAGATLVATCFSGVVDEHDRIHEGGAPGPLRDALGVVVEEFDALPPEEKQSVRFDEPLGDLATGVEHDASLLCERVWLRGARPLARYAHAFYAGDPAVTVNSCGRGKGYYVATCLEARAYGALLRAICAEHGIASPLKGGAAPPPGVEATLRTSPDGRAILYLLNHGPAVHEVPLPEGKHLDLLTKKTLSGAARLSPGDVLVLESGKTP